MIHEGHLLPIRVDMSSRALGLRCIPAVFILNLRHVKPLSQCCSGLSLFYLFLNWKQGSPPRNHDDIIKASSQNCPVQSLLLNSEKSLFLK